MSTERQKRSIKNLSHLKDKARTVANISNSTKQKLELLFGMRSGYVLDFTNASFRDFILSSAGIDVYDKYDGSKAQILREFWKVENDKNVANTILDMLDRWQTNKLINNIEITKNEQLLFEQCKQDMIELGGLSDVPVVSATDTEFLAKDLGEVDIAKLQVSLDLKDIISQRLDEIEICLKSQAPLSVILLCGSTLEGILLEVACKNPQHFNKSASAPKTNGKVKSLQTWSLEELINVARGLNVIGEDVKKHAHAVKDFRNYIHPRQQLQENFSPRMFTAEMAHKVLFAAMKDLGAKK